MRPIGTIRSCFSTRYNDPISFTVSGEHNSVSKMLTFLSSASWFCRNGTPRQPLLVSLARACLIFDPALVPPASLEGLEEYSHCWIQYVFHLNTDIEKLWRKPSQSKLKAKVRRYAVSFYLFYFYVMMFSVCSWGVLNSGESAKAKW